MTPTDSTSPYDPTPPTAPAGHVPGDHHAHDAHHARQGHDEHDSLYNEDVAHEETDVNVGQLIAYTIGLAVVCLVSAAIVLVLFNVFEAQAAKDDPVLSPHALRDGQLPPEPRLLLDEPGALKLHRTTEAEALGRYGWVDQATGVAHVPIDEAKTLLLHKGLPVRAGAPTDAWMGTHSPTRGESSSGRAIPVKPATPQPPAAVPAAPAGEHKPADAAPHKGGHEETQN